MRFVSAGHLMRGNGMLLSSLSTCSVLTRSRPQEGCVAVSSRNPIKSMT